MHITSTGQNENLEDDYYENVIEPQIREILRKNGLNFESSSESQIECDDTLVETVEKSHSEVLYYIVKTDEISIEEEVKQSLGTTLLEQTNYKWKDKKHRSSRIMSMHKINIYSCDQCNYNFRKKSDLNLHMKSTHERVIYTCKQCSYKSKFEEDMSMHIKVIHEEIHMCHKCSYYFSFKRQLKNTFFQLIMNHF